MIKINLAPIEELDSQFWYIPDLAVILLVFSVAYIGVTHYIGNIQDQIKVSLNERIKMESSVEKLAPEVKRHGELLGAKSKLTEKADSLRNITKVKLSRYMPVIVLEHLQNMKPAGVWFDELSLSNQGKEISLKGNAITNDLIAEYINILKSSSENQVIEDDLRTQVFFHSDNLNFTSGIETVDNFPDLKNVVNFEMNLNADIHRFGKQAEEVKKPKNNKKKKS